MRRRVKGASEMLAVQVADAVARMRDSDVQKPPGDRRGDRLARRTRLCSAWSGSTPAAIDRTLGSVLKYNEDQEADPCRRSRAAGEQPWVRPPFGLETVWLDLPALAGAFSRRLHDAGVPSSVRAIGPLRPRADARAAGLAAAPVLDRARGVRVGPLAGEGVRRGVRGRVRWRPARHRQLQEARSTMRRTVPVDSDERPVSERALAAADGEQQRGSALTSASAASRTARTTSRRGGPDPGRPERRGAAARQALRLARPAQSWRCSTG